MNDRMIRRGGTDPRSRAEAAFKAVTAKPVEAASEPAPVRPKPAIPAAKEQVTLRLDSDVLEHFQAGGPGWQDRINAALRRAAGKAPGA